MTGLASSFDTTFLTYEHDPEGYEWHCPRATLEAELPGVEVVTVPGIRGSKRLAQARSLLSRRSWEWGQYHRPELDGALAELVESRRPALVHFDDIGVAQAGPVEGVLNVVSPHGIEHRITGGIAEATRGVRRAFARREWRKVVREEERVWQTMDVCLALSDEEAEVMRAGGARHVELCPNGTDERDLLPPPVKAAGEPLRMMFIGIGRFQPNARGIAWFVREVLPRVRARTPAVLDVVGEPPEDPVQAEGVTYHGRVPEVESWYRQAHAVVVPLFEGTGTRLKVIEAAALGRPIVSTAFGPAGLPLAGGRDFLEADEPEAFAGHLVELGGCIESGDARLAQMLASARATAEPLFWSRISSELAETYRRLIDARSGAGALVSS